MIFRYIAHCIGLSIAISLTFSSAYGVDLDTDAILKTDPSSVLIISDGKILLSKNENTPVAVGSAFKLAILVALKRNIENGHATWDEVVPLKEQHRSLPSGIIQNMPVGTAFTLHTLATLMIALSDNTATDILIDQVGREKIEVILGSPVLTTREFFILKADAELGRRYRGNPNDPSISDRLLRAPLPKVQNVMTPWSENIEWMVPARTLCKLIEEVHLLSVFSANPGLAKFNEWDRVAFKGGSEIGVLNLTTYLKSHDGREFCVSVTWNSKTALDNNKLYIPYQQILQSLK